MNQTHAIPTGTVATEPHQRHLGAAVLAVLAVLVAITIAFVTLVLAHDSNGTPAPPVVHETPTARVDTPIAPPVAHETPTARVDTPVAPPVAHEAPDGAWNTPLCPRFGRC
jgi:hypothetical protein